MLSKLYNYTINLKNNQLYNKIIGIFLFLFILSLFFPIRHVFLSPEADLTGQYSDFTSFSLYLSDILLITTCFLLLIPPRTKSLISPINKGNNEKIVLSNITDLDNNSAVVRGRRGGEIWTKLRSIVNRQLLIVLLIFWLILGLILHFSHTTLFWTLKWLELIVAYGTVKLVTSDKLLVTGLKEQFFKVFVGFSVIQSIIALLQFYKQTSLGLYRLGESHLSVTTDNVAKLLVDGNTYIRSYGSFPHPNLLAVFLVTAIILSIYLYLNSTWKWQIVWGTSIFLNILGLTVTFSRAAYLALALGLLLFFGFLFFPLSLWERVRVRVRDFITVIVIVIVSSTFSCLLFRSFLLTRVTISDNAVTERVEYNNIGLRMIQDNPIFGVGAGESVLHMEQYSNKPLEPWQKQPIHNYFLLSAAELGIPGMLLLIWIFLSHLKSAYTDFLVTRNPLLVTILCSFLVLMLFDHYFYTLQQTQLLLWITLGIIAATKKEAIAP